MPFLHKARDLYEPTLSVKERVLHYLLTRITVWPGVGKAKKLLLDLVSQRQEDILTSQDRSIQKPIPSV